MPAQSGLPAELVELQDDYDLLGELGRGGAAVVYRARDLALGREVAIKVVHPRPTSPDDDPVARLGREARTVAQLQHPNIVAVYGVRRLRGGGLALIMQCVPGATLKAHVQRHGPLAPDACERVLRDVGAALAYAHARGVVHRDVKPENIFLDAVTGRAMLADFGIARSTQAESLTMTGTAVGTPFYMAPEQIAGDVLDGRSDLYSLGLVAWEALTGRRPWDGESLYSVLYKQKHEELPPIEALRAGVPMRLQYVIERMLQKRPAARWAGADGLLAQLDYAVLPGDYVRWQRALRARVERYTEEERRRAAERAPVGAPDLADLLARASASTVQFVRGAPLPPSNGTQGDADRSGSPGSETRGEGAHALSVATARETPALDHELALPEPGRTVDLHVPAADESGFSAVAIPRYVDSAEPTWAGLPDDGEMHRVQPGGARRVAMAIAGITAIAVCAGVVLYNRAAATPDDRAGVVGVPFPATLAGAVAVPGVGGGAASHTTIPADLTVLSAGGRHTCAASVAGPLFCWGANDRGQLGDGSATVQAAPVSVAGELTFASVAAGLSHTCAVTRTGDVYCWGTDTRGQLGDATTIRRNAPVRVAGAGVYSSVSAGVAHSCGVTTSGALRCWGANDQGQLGDGTRESRTVPTPVAAVGGAVARVAVGGQHSCAVLTDGRVQCWGAGRDGQLGRAERGGDVQLTPAPVALPEPVLAVTAGLAHSCALGRQGGVWCWGRNESGQVGDRSAAASLGPVRVRFGDGPAVVQIASGAAHTCARDAAGAVWCWGRNLRGAVGDGTTTNRPTPTRVRLPAPAVTVTAGTAHSCATLADGRTFCWGDNADGQLGDPVRTFRPVPVPVRYPAGVAPAGGAAIAPDTRRPAGVR